jgi:DNA-nicking Smr family endonuclease
MKKINVTEADRQLFRSMVASARPLNQCDRVTLKPAADIDTSGKSSAAGQRHTAVPEIDLSLSASMATPLVTTDGALSYQCQCLTRQQRRAVQQGVLPVHASLDLHHSTVAQAREQVIEFIQQCQRCQYAWGLIIHGKGLHSDGRYPVLKNQVDQWLRQLTMVKAFCSAHQRHGGLGAVYVFFQA